ncbi:MAG: response regulator transcription factor [Bacilli bacterium]|jgi:two-component system alkaline phosphatase synthesis response regulator PhoP|nr:response regulator transcription factor [Bacilli bacterium]
MKKKVLLIDNDIALLNELKKLLEKHDIIVDAIECSTEVLAMLVDNYYDLIITELDLAFVDGLTLLKSLNNITGMCPIIIMTSNKDDNKECDALENNVYEYLHKPLVPKIFLSIVKRALKRSQINSEMIIKDNTENLIIDNHKKIVYKKEEPIKLTPKEYDLLVYMINKPGLTISREELYHEIWKKEANEKTNRTVDVHVQRLRDKLDLKAISSIYGCGYCYNK